MRTFESLKDTLITNRENWIQSSTNNEDSGVGRTLEDMLGVEENCLQESDYGDYELKASRKTTKSMLTLFTKSPVGNYKNILLEKYGKDRNNKKVFHSTVSVFPNKNNLKLSVKKESLELCDEDKVIAVWAYDDLKNSFDKKFKNGKFVYVKAESKKVNDVEFFKYDDAYLVENASVEKLFGCLANKEVVIDFRIGQYQNKSIHDHGCAFRIKHRNIKKLFDKFSKIM